MTDSENSEINFKPVTVTVEIAPDEMEAYVVLAAQSDNRNISVEDIKVALAAKGVKFGIRDQILTSLSEEFEDEKRYLVAQGKASLTEDGKIEYQFETDKVTPVKAGDKIAVLSPPPEPLDGQTVTGNPVTANRGQEVKFPHTEHVFWEEKEPNILLAAENGYLKISESEIIVEPFFNIEISDDFMSVWLTVTPPKEFRDYGLEELRAFLKDSNILYGLKEDVIKSIFKNDQFGEKILVAEGTPVIHGLDGRIDYQFETELKAKRDEHGNVDYKELNIIQNFKKGDKLLELIPPKEGRPGRTITGLELTPKTGKEASMPAAKNAVPHPKNDKILISEIDGHVMKKGNSIEVVPVLTIRGDVDFSTGNIDFIGSVFINGEVKSGFSVKARDDVQVNGYVEDATIIAGGNIELKSGFGGKGDGVLDAGGKVLAKFCENQSIRSSEDIIFCEYLMHCTVDTKGRLIVSEKKGLICGGEVHAFKGVEANIIGSKTFTPTRIVAGIDRMQEERAEKLGEEREKTKTTLKKIEKARQLLLTRRMVKTKLSPENELLLKKIITLRKQLKEKLAKVLEELDGCTSDPVEAVKARVTAYEAIYPRSHIKIFDKNYEVKEALSKACFLYSSGGVLAKDLDDVAE